LPAGSVEPQPDVTVSTTPAKKRIITMKATSVLLAAFALFGAAAGAQAQDYAAPVQMAHSEQMDWGYPGMMGCGQPGMMGMGMGQPGMMGMGMERPGMMGMGGGHFRMMMPMMMAMMDTNNDGALSLEEVQAVHARMFTFIDKNKDGKVTLDEVQAAFRGGEAPAQQQQ
jgi:EF hand domain-containing protein